VVLLDMDSSAEDFSAINRMVSVMSADGDVSVLALSDSGKNIKNKNYFEGNFAEIRTQLDKILPEHKRSVAIAA
jgi:hypothetical protein